MRKGIAKDSWWVQPLVLVGLAIVAWALYGSTLGHEFHFDDYAYIIDSPEVRNLGGCLHNLINHPLRPDRMLVTGTFALNYAAHGLHPGGYHLVNIVVHLGNSWLVFLLLGQLVRSAGGIQQSACPRDRLLRGAAALLFLVHPLAVASVSYISQRHGLLATFFFLLGFLAYQHFRGSAGIAGRLCWGCVLLTSFWAAIHAKQMALTLPFVLIAYELIMVQRPRSAQRKVFLTVSGAFVGCAALVALYGLQSGLFSTSAQLAGFRAKTLWSPFSHFLTETVVFTHYLRVLLLPFDRWLAVDHAFAVIDRIDPRVLFAWLLHGCLLGAGWMAFRKGGRDFFLGILWFYLTLGIPYLAVPVLDVKVDYKAYMPGIGILIAFTAVIREIANRYGHRRILVALGLVAIMFAAGTVKRNGVYSTEESLWSDVIAKYPGEARAYNNRGLAFHRRGEYSRAVEDFRRAIAINPGYSLVYANLGDSLRERGDVAEAMASYRLYLTLVPDDGDGWVRLANIHSRAQEWETALPFYRRAVELAPADTGSLYNLGLCLAHLGKYEEAKVLLEQALASDNTNAKAAASLGAVYFRLADYARAEMLFAKSLEMEPGNGEALYNYAVILIKQGKHEAAEDMVHRLQPLSPVRAQQLKEVLRPHN